MLDVRGANQLRGEEDGGKTLHFKNGLVWFVLCIFVKDSRGDR
jgi:hypothetical protein